MFSQACVKNSVRGGHMWDTPPWTCMPPQACTSPGMHAPRGYYEIWSMSGWYTSYWNAFLLPPAMKLGQGYVFTRVAVILFTGGVCLSACWDTTHPPQEQTPPQGADSLLPASPWEQTPPGSSACWEIRATSGRYASYWNAFLFENSFFLLMYFMFLPLS